MSCIIRYVFLLWHTLVPIPSQTSSHSLTQSRSDAPTHPLTHQSTKISYSSLSNITPYSLIPCGLQVGLTDATSLLLSRIISQRDKAQRPGLDQTHPLKTLGRERSGDLSSSHSTKATTTTSSSSSMLTSPSSLLDTSVVPDIIMSIDSPTT